MIVGFQDLDFLKKVSDETYMPFGVGGGIRNVEDIRDILKAGAEKVSINTAASRYRRGLAKLRTVLEEVPDDDD